MTGTFWGVTGLAGNLAMLSLLGYGGSSLEVDIELISPGGHLVSSGDITVGDLTSLLMYSA